MDLVREELQTIRWISVTTLFIYDSVLLKETFLQYYRFDL